MKKMFSVVIAGFALGMVFAPVAARAEAPFLDTFNAKYGTTATKLNTCSVCHRVAPALNPYGNAFKNKWKSGLSVSQALGAVQTLDSDRDTFTNIREIRARTFPGRKASHP